MKGHKGPGRPSAASSIGEFGKDSKPIKSFFSQSEKMKSPRKDSKPNPQAEALVELEQRLVSVEGLSRTEARHVAMATMASLKGASTLDHQVAADGGLCGVEGKGSGFEKNEGDVQFPAILRKPGCEGIPAHDLNVLKNMWGRGAVIIDAQPPFGVQLKREDFERLLSPGIGPAGWVNDVIMDFIGKLVNKVHNKRYAFHSYLRECFLLGPEKGRRGLVRIVKKVWAQRNDETGLLETVVPDEWYFPLIRDGDPHWWLMHVDVEGRTYRVLDPFCPNRAAPAERVRVAQELLTWVLQVLFKNRLTLDEFEYEVEYLYQLPTQVDGYNCGIYVGMYMLMISRNCINYTWPRDMDQFRWRLALAIEYNDPEIFLETQLQK